MSKVVNKRDVLPAFISFFKFVAAILVAVILLKVSGTCNLSDRVAPVLRGTHSSEPPALERPSDLAPPSASAPAPAVSASSVVLSAGGGGKDGAHFNGVSTGARADWGDDPASKHPFCAALNKDPIPRTSWCTRDADQRCINGAQKGQITFFSQVAQDYYLYTQHFIHLRRRGTYAEVATRNPVGGSNTYFMDACLGWKGVCVEANPETFTFIHRLRSCELVPTCVSATDKEKVSFLLHGDSGGVEDTNKNKEEWSEKDAGRKVSLECMSMEVVLNRRAITVLDYLSLDVEGHELEVLKGFDWDKTVINTMTIETTDESLAQIEPFLVARGYVRHTPTYDAISKRTKLLRRDAVFLHKDVVWGKPV